MTELVIFDCDGVLVDSEPISIRIDVEMFAEVGVTVSEQEVIDHFVGRIFSATEVANGKPAPDLFLHAARRMGVDPGACVVVEDSHYGVLAARAAGMDVLGYAGGVISADALAGPRTIVFDDMRSLPGLLS